MKKCKLAAMAWLSVCIVLFTSCFCLLVPKVCAAEEKQPYPTSKEDVAAIKELQV